MVQLKIRATESGTDLITISRCFLSFKTVITSRNIIVFKIFFSRKKTAILVVQALWYLVQLVRTYILFYRRFLISFSPLMVASAGETDWNSIASQFSRNWTQ